MSQHNGMNYIKITKYCYINIIPFQQEEETIKIIAFL
jgi:hypothetical protein